MNEREATQLLERLGGMLEVSGAPIDRLVEAGKRVGHRRRRWQIGGIAAAAAIAAIGIGVLAQNTPTSDTAPPTTHRTDSSDEILVVPPGTRLVGANGVVVAVPESFTTEDLPCGSPDTDTVTFRPDFKPKTVCTFGSSTAALVEVVDPQSAQWHGLLESPADHVIVDGLHARRASVECFVAESINDCSGSLTFPSSGVAFLVQTHRAGGTVEINTILDSAQAVPGGFTTVPSVIGLSIQNSITAIEAAGLVVDRPCKVPECYSFASGTEPPAGTPVKIGSVVSMHYDGSYADVPPTQDDLLGAWQARQIGETAFPQGQRWHGDIQLLHFERLGGDFWFRGSEGCNETSGYVRLEGRRFSTSHISTTLVGCPRPDPSVAAVVTGAASVTLTNGHLRFYDTDGRRLATFVRYAPRSE